MKSTVEIDLKCTIGKKPIVGHAWKKVRKALNNAVKTALSKVKKEWSFDGRVSKFTQEGEFCFTTLSFIRKAAFADENVLIKSVVAAARKADWVANKGSKPAAAAEAPKSIKKAKAAKPSVTLDDDADVRPPALKEAAVEAPAPVQAEPVVTVEEVKPDPEPESEPPPINTEHGQFFAHIYERETQISLLYSTVMAAVETGFYSRSHSIILGDPGCGKTEIMRSFKAMLGDDHVTLLDGPSTTKAGIEQLILQAKRIPSFLFVEEIDKMPQSVSQVLLGPLDARAEIRQTNARGGHQNREAKVLCIATVNDPKRFKEMNLGALSSRFSHQVYCPRPDRDLLHKIVGREVAAVNGNPFWVNAAVSYCTTVEENYDPRRSIAVCLSGRDDLLDGTYQKKLESNQKLRDNNQPKK